MRVAELWRYPVKSLRGEQLDATELTATGIPGDRLVQVRRPGGRVITARTHPALLGHQGPLDADGCPTIDGVPWDDPRSLAVIRAAATPDAELVYYDGTGPQRFDVLPLSVVTDGAVEAVGVDRRRFRPNVLLAGVAGLEERNWVGRELRIGEARIGVRQVRARCVMTTFDPETLEQDLTVLQKIVFDLDGVTALDCSVLEPGRVAVGDTAEVLGYWTLPRSA